MIASAIPILAIVAVIAAAGATTALGDAYGISIKAPSDIKKEAFGYFTEVDIGTASASSPHGPVSITSSAPDRFLLGTTPVYWLATDTTGNRTVAIQYVTVEDTTPPYFPNLPKYVVFETDSPKPAPVHFDMLVAKDLVDINVDVSSSHKSGQKFKVGNTTVTFTAKDDSGNIATVDIVVILNDTSPKIQNLAVRPYNSFIHVTWDPMEGHDQYRVVLTKTDTKERVSTLKTSLTSYYFAELEPFTKYTVAVSALNDANTKVKVDTNTRFLMSSILDEFETIDDWAFINNYPVYYANTYKLGVDQSVGNPAPSAKMSGDAARGNIFMKRILDLTGFKAGDLFIEIDYKIDHAKPVNIIFYIVEMEFSGGGDRLYRTTLSSTGGTDNNWKSFSANVTSHLEDARLVELRIHTRDYDWGGGDRVIHFDNFRLFNVHKDG